MERGKSKGKLEANVDRAKKRKGKVGKGKEKGRKIEWGRERE